MRQVRRPHRFSTEEIGAVLGMSANAVRCWLRKEKTTFKENFPAVTVLILSRLVPQCIAAGTFDKAVEQRARALGWKKVAARK